MSSLCHTPSTSLRAPLANIVAFMQPLSGAAGDVEGLAGGARGKKGEQDAQTERTEKI